jgi:hypothetical protein
MVKPLSLLVLAVLAGLSHQAARAASSEAGERCEAAVADAIREARGQGVQDVQFDSARRVLAPGDNEEIGVKGEGHYRSRAGSAAFSYSCAFSGRTGHTSGVLFRESDGSTPAARNWQPDLLNLNPRACETAVAAALKGRHPRVTGIQFEADTRRLSAADEGRTAMEGGGRLQRAPGMAAQAFSYRCDFERGSQRIARVDTADQ